MNELDALPNTLVLVLDDYHAIEDRQVHAGMGFLIDRRPPHVHLVLASTSAARARYGNAPSARSGSSARCG